MLTKPQKLTVMSWAGVWGRSLIQAVSQPFIEATGIAVEHSYNIGLKAPVELVDALEAGRRAPLDIIWSNSGPAITAAKNGWCETLHDNDANDENGVPRLNMLHPRARPDGFVGWPFVFPYVVHYVLAYRESVFPAGRPESWLVMMESRFKNRIALYPGGNGFYPIAQVMGGGSVADIPADMDPCWRFVRRLRPQVARLDYSIGLDARISSGELDIIFRALPNAIGFREQGLDVAWAVPREGITDTLDALWIPKGAPEGVAYWAKRYIDFALSREVQEKWCGMLGVMPLHREASLPRVYASDRCLPKDPDDYTMVLHVPENVKAEHQSLWEGKFNRIFAGDSTAR
jgi:putative spermidine/putrescine transport system substrate-binding protein